MKKIIWVIGILFLAIVLVLNILFTANMNYSEQITIEWNSIWYIIGLIALGLLIFFVTKIVDKYLYDEDTEKKKKLRKIILIIFLTIYVLFSIVWVLVVRPGIWADQIHVANVAQTMYRGDLNEFLPNLTYANIPLSEYIQAYSQQITLAFVYNIFFRIIHFDAVEVLRALNVISVFLIVFALYKITMQISKKYKTNRVLLFTLILTFISLPMLSTFVYGDIPSLALCLFSVYFMMRYTETKKWKYGVISSIFVMVGYMMRMNSLIFVIATVIYLLLNLLKEITKKPWKENLLNTAMIIVYLIIAIIPSILVKNYYINKYDLDKSKSMPSINYILMAMEIGPRANGWYNEVIGEYALKNPEAAREEYPERVKERLTYFIVNPGYTFDFYTKKVTSMWTENTYSAISNNNTQGEDDVLENIRTPLTFYQKVLLIVTCVCCLIVLIQNRKDISLDVLFLITIFIGGFAFHILWEAKSRYIIPYIIVLIPVASIAIQKCKCFRIKHKNV